MHKTLLVLVLVAAGFFAHLADGIEVTPPSPVPAMTDTVVMVPSIVKKPTVITVTCSEDSFAFVLGVVDGQMYLPKVVDVSSGKFTFSGPAGTYVVMGQEDGKRFQEQIIIEAGDGPPPPPPPPPPPEPGQRKVTIVYESADYSAGFALATQRLQSYCRQHAEKHRYRLIDDDAKLPDGSQPEWLMDYIAVAKGKEIRAPFMVIESDDVVLAIVPFPSTKGEAIKVLQTHGG